MEMAFTAVFKMVPEGYIAFVEELAGANSQGETLEEETVTRYREINEHLDRKICRDLEVPPPAA